MSQKVSNAYGFMLRAANSHELACFLTRKNPAKDHYDFKVGNFIFKSC